MKRLLLITERFAPDLGGLDINTRSRIMIVDKSVKIILVCAAGQKSELDIFNQLTHC